MKESGKDRNKYAVYESTRAPQKREANPASLRSAAPSKGRGLRGYSLLPMEGGAPKGRRLDGDSGMKKSEGDRLKYAINESTLSTAARSPVPNGEGYETRIPLSPKHSLSCVGKAKRRRLRRQKKKANPASLRSAAPSKGEAAEKVQIGVCH